MADKNSDSQKTSKEVVAIDESGEKRVSKSQKSALPSNDLEVV